MDIVEGTIKYYPSLAYRHYNIRLLFGWVLFYHKDAWTCDIQIYKPEYKQITLLRWRKRSK